MCIRDRVGIEAYDEATAAACALAAWHGDRHDGCSGIAVCGQSEALALRAVLAVLLPGGCP